MKSITISIFTLLFVCYLLSPSLLGQKVAEPFEFQFENKTLRGLIEKPKDQDPKSIIILIPGYGRTDYVEGGWYSTLRNELVKSGLTVIFWDKMGCGKSEGEFDINQPVENSADEAIAAIQKIKKLGLPGSDKIGFWGTSRAGWIVPLINQQFPIKFWISVSAVDDKENYGYLLKSNLLIAGKSEAEAEKLYKAWMKGHKVFSTSDNYKKHLKAVRPLLEDSLSRRLFGYTNDQRITQEAIDNYKRERKQFTSKGYFDKKSGLWAYIEDFEELLFNLNCPVLALFGANDSQVDWRKTKKVYENTIGKNPKASLKTKVFENCNHNLQKCITCAFGEDLSELKWQACDNYYETMVDWLKTQKIIK